MPTDHSKWANRQVAAAIAIGINPLDAANAVNAFLVVLPPGADPDTYIVPVYALEQGAPSDPLADLRASWYGDEGIAPRYKRLLDAKGVE